MPSLTIKNIPENIYQKLKVKAQRNKRSLNSEILDCLETSVENRKINIDDLIKRARNIRAGINYKISEKEITENKRSNRK